MVVRSSVTGKGAAVCWMITNSSTHHPVKAWLNWLKDELDFTAGAIMIDNSDIEIRAIRDSYGEDANIYLCHWHILRAWRKNLVYKVRPQHGNKASAEEVREHRQKALSLMIAIMNAPTVAEYNTAYRRFSKWAYDNQDKWDAGDLVVYFDNEYAPKKKEWSRVYRKVMYT